MAPSRPSEVPVPSWPRTATARQQGCHVGEARLPAAALLPEWCNARRGADLWHLDGRHRRRRRRHHPGPGRLGGPAAAATRCGHLPAVPAAASRFAGPRPVARPGRHGRGVLVGRGAGQGVRAGGAVGGRPGGAGRAGVLARPDRLPPGTGRSGARLAAARSACLDRRTDRAAGRLRPAGARHRGRRAGRPAGLDRRRPAARGPRRGVRRTEPRRYREPDRRRRR